MAAQHSTSDQALQIYAPDCLSSALTHCEQDAAPAGEKGLARLLLSQSNAAVAVFWVRSADLPACLHHTLPV